MSKKPSRRETGRIYTGIFVPWLNYPLPIEIIELHYHPDNAPRPNLHARVHFVGRRELIYEIKQIVEVRAPRLESLGLKFHDESIILEGKPAWERGRGTVVLRLDNHLGPIYYSPLQIVNLINDIGAAFDSPPMSRLVLNHEFTVRNKVGDQSSWVPEGEWLLDQVVRLKKRLVKTV